MPRIGYVALSIPRRRLRPPIRTNPDVFSKTIDLTRSPSITRREEFHWDPIEQGRACSARLRRSRRSILPSARDREGNARSLDSTARTIGRSLNPSSRSDAMHRVRGDTRRESTRTARARSDHATRSSPSPSTSAAESQPRGPTRQEGRQKMQRARELQETRALRREERSTGDLLERGERHANRTPPQSNLKP